MKRISYPLLLQRAQNQQTLTSNDGANTSFEHQHEGSGSMPRWFIQFISDSPTTSKKQALTQPYFTGGEPEAKVSDFPRLHGRKFPFPTFKSLLLQVWPSSVPIQGKKSDFTVSWEATGQTANSPLPGEEGTHAFKALSCYFLKYILDKNFPFSWNSIWFLTSKYMLLDSNYAVKV